MYRGVLQRAAVSTGGRVAAWVGASLFFAAIHLSPIQIPGLFMAGLLFGALHSGGLAMQSIAQTPLTLATVLQALIVLFVAAPMLINTMLPFLKNRGSGTDVPAGGLA